MHELEVALHKPATRHEMLVIVGAILSGIPAAKDAPLSVSEAIIETLAHDADDAFSAGVIWASRFHIWPICKFTPAPCEMLEAARKARCIHIEALDASVALLLIRDDAEGICDQDAAGSYKLSGRDIPF